MVLTAADGTEGLAPRAAALGLLHDVLHEGRPLDEAALPGGLAGPDRARAVTLAGTALRHLRRIDALLAAWAPKPPPLRVRNALRLCAAEILFAGTAPHAAVDAAVALASAVPKTRHLAGLANAVGRRLAREGRAALEALGDLPPDPFHARLAEAWGEGPARAMAAAHAATPPLDLTPRDPGAAPALAAALGAGLLPTGSLRLAGPLRVSALPGYAEGAWWVQDAAASLPVRLLGGVAGLRVLDLCAAPGGKTLQLAAAGARVTALDLPGPRLDRLGENLLRTGLAAEIVAADAFAFTPEAPFDAVVLDAPCSASGTARRHPDLPHLFPARDIAALVRLQNGLLGRAWSWVRPGGRLLYCTCSLLPDEGEARIARFLARHAEARPAEPAPVPGVEPGWLAGGRLRTRPDFWPELGGMDGFFAALLAREA